MELKRLEETEEARIGSDNGLPAMDESNETHNARLSVATKSPVSMRKMALSLSQFLKEQKASLANRRQDDRKQAQP
jgi:hypothetical protein